MRERAFFYFEAWPFSTLGCNQTFTWAIDNDLGLGIRKSGISDLKFIHYWVMAEQISISGLVK